MVKARGKSADDNWLPAMGASGFSFEGEKARQNQISARLLD
jgi:hypothetical protein